MTTNEPEPRGCRKAGTLIGTVVAAAFVLLWMVGGPGPKYEEQFGAVLLAIAVALCGAVAAALDPRPLLAPALFAAIWSLGYLVMWIQIAVTYDYSFWKLEPFLFGLKVAVVFLVFLVFANVICAMVHSAFSRTPPS